MIAVRRLLERASGRSGASSAAHPLPLGGTTPVVRALLLLAVISALATAGCGGGSELRITNPGGGTTIELEFPPGKEWKHSLPTISGGFRPYEASLEGCPDWVRLLFPDTRFPHRRVLAGIAPADARGQEHLCTYRVTEADPGFRPQRSVSYGLRLAVGSKGALTLPDVIEIDALSVGDFHEEALPTATGGIEPYEYSFTCAGGQLPPGMSFAPSPPVLAGTPDARFRDSCTYTVTDSAQPAESFSRVVQVEVTGDGLSLPTVPPISLTVSERGTKDLPPAMGGIEPYTYSLTCAGGQLPPGMSFAPSPPLLAGTPVARFRDSCTYTVTDSAHPPESFSRVVQVEVASRMLTLSRDPSPITLSVGDFHNGVLPEAAGGVQPYEYSFACGGEELPPGMSFAPETRRFAGTPDAAFRDSCTYSVTDNAQPAQTVSATVDVIVEPLDRGTWRFRARTVEPGGPCTRPDPGTDTPVATLPHAQGGEAGEDVYTLIDFPNDHFLTFDQESRQLTYTHPSAVPILGTPNTYRYLVGATGVNATNADDALCLDVQFNAGASICPEPAEQFIHIQLQVRDDAFWDENADEYRCPDSTAPAPRSNSQNVSNPVHTALAPVHARRAVDVAHAAIRDRVRDWSPGDSRGLTAIGPVVGLASLSGESGGFDYSGTSESLSAGAELGTGSWQAGLVATFVRTDLDYRAGSNLRERGYLAGEHDTEFLSLHPFAAWHASSGGHLWASLGAGAGELSHRDDLGFQSWSRSDASLLSYTAGAALPIAELLSGELQAEAGIEAFALEIEGGGSISSSLPTMRGRDYRAGLAWSAPLPGTPSISVAYKHLTGDGRDGGSLETEGSFSVAGFLDPRVSVTGSAEASTGLGDHDQDLWGLGIGLRFAPDGLRRGFGLEVDTRLLSLANERSQSVSIRGEAGYGLWGGPFFGTVRPYVGVIGDTNRQSVQPTLGLALRETPNSAAGVEFRERPDIDRALMFTLWLRP